MQLQTWFTAGLFTVAVPCWLSYVASTGWAESKPLPNPYANRIEALKSEYQAPHKLITQTYAPSRSVEQIPFDGLITPAAHGSKMNHWLSTVLLAVDPDVENR